MKENIGAEHIQVQGGYQPMRARNAITNKLEEVVLVDAVKFADFKELAVDSQIELKLDLKRALSKFNEAQRKVLFRTLVQGMSIEAAVEGVRIGKARVRKSNLWWWRWMNNIALPQIRSKLADYVEKGKLVV